MDDEPTTADGTEGARHSVLAVRRDELVQLLRESFEHFFCTHDGRNHLTIYTRIREIAQANYAEVEAAEQRGEDTTEAVLVKLLPHMDTPYNRDRGAWTHIAPVIRRDLRQWFDATTPNRDWPAVSREILLFIRTCLKDPGGAPSRALGA